MTSREIPADQMAQQMAAACRVAERNAALPAPPCAYVDTYGCQQNEADSEKIRGFLREMGYRFVQDPEGADIVVLNTCAVREHAEQRVFGNIGALTHTKRRHPGQKIVLCGCMAQEPHVAQRLMNSYRHVDLVFGPHALWRFPEFVERLLQGEGRIFATDPSDGEIAEGLPTERTGGVKAWLSIMSGCNNFCTYCIVPYVRGRERSRRPEQILAEARDIIRGGAKDITLLGQNVNSYGNDAAFSLDFPGLLRQINGLEGDFLIRFMTSHPKDASEALFDAMAECPKVARHLHLPFQAGSDRVLKAMNRRYTAAQYLEKIAAVRQRMPDIVLTSDVIVGFPGETEAEFQQTLDLVEQVGFDALFTFIYSPRRGTPAAELPDPVPREEKGRWFQQLLDVQNRISAQKHAAYVGSRQRVLIDGATEEGLTGRTNGGRLVRLAGDKSLVGQFVQAEITDSNTWALYGRLC